MRAAKQVSIRTSYELDCTLSLRPHRQININNRTAYLENLRATLPSPRATPTSIKRHTLMSRRDKQQYLQHGQEGRITLIIKENIIQEGSTRLNNTGTGPPSLQLRPVQVVKRFLKPIYRTGNLEDVDTRQTALEGNRKHRNTISHAR